MERRKFIIGAGALASGSAAAIGTGAFSVAETERNITAVAVDDSDALLALHPGLESDIVSTTAMGGDGSRDGPHYLEIDFDLANGGDGINPNSKYQLGVSPETGSYIYDDRSDNDGWATAEDRYEDEHAFRIVNQDSEPKDITVEFEPNEDIGSNAFGLVAIHDDEVVNHGDNTGFTGGTISHTAEDVAAGDTVYVVFAMSIGTYNTDIDMGGEITVTAEQ